MNTPVLSKTLSPESVTAIASLSLLAQQIAERWVLGWPKETKALERSGKLIKVLKDEANREQSTLADARQGGENSHLANHELMDLYDISPRPPF